jgi:hypothetical protein
MMASRHSEIMGAALRLTGLFWCVAGTMTAAAEEKAASATLPPEVQKAFEWYDTLGYQKTSALQWVGVLPGEEVPSYDPKVEKLARVPTRAFLLHDDDKQFSVIMPDLRQRTFKKEVVTLSISLPPEEFDMIDAAGARLVFPEARLDWEKQSFEKDARALLALGKKVLKALEPPPPMLDSFADPKRFAPRDPFVEQNPAPSPPDAFWIELGGLGEILGDRYTDISAGPLRAILFIVAHACHERKLTALAGELCATAALLPNPDSEDPEGPDLLSIMQRDLGYLAIFRAVEAVGGTEYGLPWRPELAPPMQTRKQLLQRFRDFPNLYPASKYVADAKKISAMLETMVAEDEAHVSPTDEEMKRMTVGQQVQELIFRLRDQNGHQWNAPGDCDVFDDYFREQVAAQKERDSPADRLASIGIPAVPQLIAALEDKHLTRTVACWRRYTYSHIILTVGDCAEAVLKRIAGRSFEVRPMPYEEEKAARHDLIKAWWKEVQGDLEQNKSSK